MNDGTPTRPTSTAIPTRTPPEQDGLWSPGRRALTIGLVLNVTIVASEALAVGTIMPVVAGDLAGGSRDLYGWVFSAFLLGSLVGIVIAGTLIDRGSLVTPFVLGIGLFSAGLLVGGLAPSMEVLVGARLLQGVGAGAIPAVAYVAIGRALPERLRPKMFATLSTAWVLPGVFGPALAGIVADTFDWRFVFLGLLPLIAVSASFTFPAIKAVRSVEPAADDDTTSAARRLPIAVVLALSAGMLVAGLTDAQLIPGVPLVVAGIAIGIPAFARLTPPGTLRAVRGLPAAVLLRGVMTFTFFAADVYVPLALEDWRGLSATEAGLVLTGATLSWTAGAWIQAHYVDRIGVRRFVGAGAAVTVVGIVGFAAVLSPAIPVWLGAIGWGLAGLGMGLCYSPFSLVVLREAPEATQGAATAGLQLSDVLGTSLGTGIGGAIVAYAHRTNAEGWVGLAGAFTVAVAVGLVGLALSGRMPGPVRDGHRADHDEIVVHPSEPMVFEHSEPTR